MIWLSCVIYQGGSEAKAIKVQRRFSGTWNVSPKIAAVWIRTPAPFARVIPPEFV